MSSVDPFTWWHRALPPILCFMGLGRPMGPAASDAWRQPREGSGFDRATAHFGRSEWQQAFDELGRLADQGHPDASRIALMMRSHGPRLFGGRFVASAERHQRWLEASMPSKDGD